MGGSDGGQVPTEPSLSGLGWRELGLNDSADVAKSGPGTDRVRVALI